MFSKNVKRTWPILFAENYLKLGVFPDYIRKMALEDLVLLNPSSNWAGGPAFDLEGGGNTMGAPSFAQFAKGGSLGCRHQK